MFHLTIAITLLTLIAAMHLLAKSKKEALGIFFKGVSWFVIVSCVIIILFEFLHGHGRHGHDSEARMDHHEMMHGSGCENKHDACCRGKHHGGEGEEHHRMQDRGSDHSTADTAAHAGMHESK